jgi:hypothetical protein
MTFGFLGFVLCSLYLVLGLCGHARKSVAQLFSSSQRSQRLLKKQEHSVKPKNKAQSTKNQARKKCKN